MKKNYFAPEISVCRFDTKDIITESGMTASQIVAGQLGETSETKTTSWDIMN